jgi:cyclic pyranopterin phosphate synthase
MHVGEGVVDGPLEEATDRPAIVDGHQRPINSIRISVTRECNLACFYCHEEGMVDDEELMTSLEIQRIAQIAANLGVRKVKLTGGEPLEHKDIIDIVSRISPLFDEVSMTTNAVNLAPIAQQLQDAGLARVNISLNTLRADRYERIFGIDHLDDVINGIEAAIEAGLTPVKLNMVLINGVNDDELEDLMSFAAIKGAILQIIEMETTKSRTTGALYETFHKNIDEIHQWMEREGRSIGANPLHNRERYILDHLSDGRNLPGPVIVELVMPMHNAGFCANCTRIRVTAGGQVKGCLFDKNCIEDLLGPLRTGENDAGLEALIMDVVAQRRPYWTSTKGDPR